MSDQQTQYERLSFHDDDLFERIPLPGRGDETCAEHATQIISGPEAQGQQWDYTRGLTERSASAVLGVRRCLLHLSQHPRQKGHESVQAIELLERD